MVNFLTWTNPEIKEAGTLVLTVKEERLKLEFDPERFTVAVEPVPLDDRRLSNVWAISGFPFEAMGKHFGAVSENRRSLFWVFSRRSTSCMYSD